MFIRNSKFEKGEKKESQSLRSSGYTGHRLVLPAELEPDRLRNNSTPLQNWQSVCSRKALQYRPVCFLVVGPDSISYDSE